MASSLLRFGRIRPLKYLQVESWGIMRSHPVASFCIQTGDPAKPAKKTKAVSKTAEAPDERETLLAYKTAVDFPVRLSQSVTAFPAQSLGVAEPVTIVAAAASASTPDDTVAPATGSSEPGSLATDGSSSSSSSDSDSDSDSEDEKPDVKAETKTSQHELSESTVKKEAEKQDVISKVTEEHKHEKKVPAEPENTPVRAAEAVQEAALAAVVATIEATQTTVETPSVSSEESVDSVPEICSATEDDLEVPSIKVSAEAPVKLTLDIREDAASQAVPDAQTKIVPTETTQPTSAKAPAEAEGTAKTAAEVSDAVESTEALVDCAPVVAEAAGEKLKADTAVEPPEEAAAAAPPEPEEPFDNSTYKNYQHHSYTPYTFVDLDVEMAKFRLPQPSSGRPSPRH